MSLRDQGGIGWLQKIADAQEMSSPDGRLKRQLEAEKDAIIEALETVGQYVLEVDGLGYIIRSKEK